MTKLSQQRERRMLREKIRRFKLNEDDLLVSDNSKDKGTLKKNVHPYVRELLSSR